MKIAYLLFKLNMHKVRDYVKKNRIINKKTITDDLYREFLFLMIHGKLNRSRVNKFIKNFVVQITTNIGKHNARVCITPFMK